MEYSPQEILEGIVQTAMPFGKYKGTPLYRLPEAYLVWMKREGFPKGKLGQQLATLYEIRLNGLEHLLDPIRQKAAKR